MNMEERSGLIAEYARGYDGIAAAAAAIPKKAWDYEPAPQEWGVKQLLRHMADSEMVGATRLYMIIAQPGSRLTPYDDAAWSRELAYSRRDPQEALEIFRLIRQTNSDLLKRIPESAFTNAVVHPDNVYPEYGKDYNLEKWLRIYTRHVRDHVGQLGTIHAAWKESGAGR